MLPLMMSAKAKAKGNKDIGRISLEGGGRGTGCVGHAWRGDGGG